MKRRSSAGEKNWPISWQRDQPNESVSPARDAREQKKNVELEPTLERLVEPETGGDPMSEQKWVRSSLRHLSKRLADLGHRVSPPTAGRLLRQLGYSLRMNSKKHEASSAHPDRNTQFEYIQTQKDLFQAA